jgi:signal transduction histidine kinase
VRLRTRFALVMALGAVVPLVGAGALARVVLVDRFAQISARRSEAAIQRVSRALTARVEAQQRLLDRFCAHDYLVDRAALQLETGRFDEAARQDLNALLPAVRDALGFDALSLVRDGGAVLASAHYPGLAGRVDVATWTLAARRRPTDRWVRPMRFYEPRGPADRLVLESTCVHRRGVAVAVSGGVSLTARFVAELAPDDEARARVVLGAAPVDEPAARFGTWRRVLSLRGPDGAAVASVVVEGNDPSMRDLARDLDALILVALAFATLLAVLLAVLVAPPLTRPLARLAADAERIALGERDIDVLTDAAGELGSLQRAFARMARELTDAEKRVRRAERLAAWRDIARQMAHEIKNPLTPIRMAVEMLRKARARDLPDFGELFEEETKVVLDEVERLRRLVEDFSRFARAPRPRPESLRVEEVAQRVVDLHAGDETPVDLLRDGDAGEIRADRDQLTQVLVNLVANACHAARERSVNPGESAAPRVRVRTRSLGADAVRVEVEDNGPGIAPEVMERLFEPYVTNKRGGTGLGLAVAHRIVTEHGGTLTADTGAWGTRFSLDLPRAGPPPAAQATHNDESRGG